MTQISLQLPENVLSKAKKYARNKGYSSVQDFIREIVRERLFDGELFGGKYTAFASEKALAKNWLVKEEDKAWEHLQKEI